MKTWFFLITLAFLFASCEKIDVPKDTPSCVKSMIKNVKDNGSCIDVVYKYDYKGETVYFFTDDGKCRDYLQTVYNENCKLVCTLGGFTGHGDNQCPDFYQLKENEILIWSR